MGELAIQFFDNPWIDAEIRDGKASGAFSHPTVTTIHPYILMNFEGYSRDEMTLAHEMGHGVHQLLAAEQGELMSSTPLTLAETASVFSEMLTFNAILNAESKFKDSTKDVLDGSTLFVTLEPCSTETVSYTHLTLPTKRIV